MRRPLGWLILAATACGAAAAAAPQGEMRVPSPAVSPSRELVDQKAAFLKRVLSDSLATKRIEAGSNAEARKHLARALENYRAALLSIRKNDIAGADRQLNQATWLIGRARQMVPDPAVRDVEHRVRYAQLQDSVESLRVSYRRHLQRVKPHPAGIAGDDALLAKVTQLVDRAKELAESEQVAQANRSLSEAERVLMVGVSRVLGSRTIEYSHRFGSPAEEYAYELERNQSYADLVPIALEGFKPAPEAIREAERLVDVNRRLRQQAQRHAAAGDHGAALATLHNGTTELQQALAAAGLRVPRDSQPE